MKQKAHIRKRQGLEINHATMSDNIPDVQKAWINVGRGSPAQALVLKSDWPVPKQLGVGEVLVKVQAAALNPVGWKFFKILPNFIAARPRVAEFDLSGVVVDANGTRFSNGDHVYGWIPTSQLLTSNQGALAEYTRVHEDCIVNRPPNVTPIEASGLTLAGMTAYTAIMKKIDIHRGQRILINGGSSAVGAYAIQLAKIKGATVTATASTNKQDFVYKMGAEGFIDYTKVSLPEYLTKNAANIKYDYIFDAVGLIDPSLYTWSEAYLAPGGAFLTTGSQPKNLSLSEMWNTVKSVGAMFRPQILGGVRRRYINCVVFNNIEDNKEFQRFVSEGSIKPIVDSVYDFHDALKAYDHLITGNVSGKVVVKVDP
ncbi:hypothetical protein B0H34DRAFT_299328 [Crassisporium funariophilum]|nr:hypothetical protein B0H34DRAFT_299328 [Crassisporium funariophilum]